MGKQSSPDLKKGTRRRRFRRANFQFKRAINAAITFARRARLIFGSCCPFSGCACRPTASDIGVTLPLPPTASSARGPGLRSGHLASAGCGEPPRGHGAAASSDLSARPAPAAAGFQASAIRSGTMPTRPSATAGRTRRPYVRSARRPRRGGAARRAWRDRSSAPTLCRPTSEAGSASERGTGAVGHCGVRRRRYSIECE
jgi:hypothetical protein